MASPSWRVVDPDTCLPYVWVLPPIRWKSSWPRQGHPTDPAVPPLSLLKEVSIAGDRLRAARTGLLPARLVGASQYPRWDDPSSDNR
jgi:hypothetical protein